MPPMSDEELERIKIRHGAMPFQECDESISRLLAEVIRLRGIELAASYLIEVFEDTATDPSHTGPRTIEVMSSKFNFDAIDEMRVLLGRAAAEAGKWDSP